MPKYALRLFSTDRMIQAMRETPMHHDEIITADTESDAIEIWVLQNPGWWKMYNAAKRTVGNEFIQIEELSEKETRQIEQIFG